MPDRPSFGEAASAIGARGIASLEQVFEEAPFGIYLDDPSHGCIYANPALLDQWISCWSDLTTFEVYPVIDSATAAQRLGTPWDGDASPPEPPGC